MRYCFLVLLFFVSCTELPTDYNHNDEFSVSSGGSAFTYDTAKNPDSLEKPLRKIGVLEAKITVQDTKFLKVYTDIDSIDISGKKYSVKERPFKLVNVGGGLYVTYH